MPPPSASTSLHLHVQPQPFFLVQLKATEPLPDCIVQRIAAPLDDSEFLSITRTKDEVSIVSDFCALENGTTRSTEWRCIRVAGPMDLSLTGIMNYLTTPLKAAKIPIFAISTWDTDFLLVPIERGDEAVDVMRNDGWVVQLITRKVPGSAS